ncbi:MAG: hypothetical protein JO364_14140 [Pseudonocardiales bacterium]|nr:hypothetical protein [Pseudonocardiales bacterium]MBV9031410.1 hypothetical protein [Pseudonocardiales bacterium]
MSGSDEHPLPRGSRRIMMVSTAVMAAAAAAVLALGTHDARLLRLGLVAALWAALLGAFDTARARREISSGAEHVDQLRTAYQRELEREVAARREYTLTAERERREQAELSQRREIVELHNELAAMRASLERLLDGDSLLERVTLRAEATRLLPLPANPRTFDDSRARAAAATTAVAAPSTRSPISPELRFGPSSPPASTWGSAPSSAGRGVSPGEISHGQGRHGVPSRGWSGSDADATSSYNGSPRNGSPTNGFSYNGGGARQAPRQSSSAPLSVQAQRTVSDLLAAHGAASVPRRRHSQEDLPPA